MISDQLTKDELSASSREEFVLASKIHRAPLSLVNANCEPEVGEDEDCWTLRGTEEEKTRRTGTRTRKNRGIRRGK